MNPGSNLLKKAFKVIAKQTFEYKQFTGRVTNGIGIDVPSYLPPVKLRGSIQPVPRTLYQQMGLDWKKDYINIYSTDVIEGVGRDSSGDKIIWNGNTYQALSENDWQPVDGWNGVLFIKDGA